MDLKIYRALTDLEGLLLKKPEKLTLFQKRTLGKFEFVDKALSSLVLIDLIYHPTSL